MLQKTVKKSLRIDVVWVQNLADARELLRADNRIFSLAILDLVLPDAPNGEIVDLFLGNKVPTIVLSGGYSSNLRDRLFAKGILDYFIKDNIQVIDAVIYFINRFFGNKRINVLVVDDSKSARGMLGKFLVLQGFSLFSAACGADALDILSHHDIHLVITDYQMPKMDGFELTRKIRASYSRYEVAIIGLSSHGDSEVEVHFIKAGANDYLPKPFQKEALSCRISQTVEIIERYREQAILVQRHSSILGNALDAIITIDQSGLVVGFNPAAESLFGYYSSEIMGKEIADFIIPESLREKHRVALQRFVATPDQISSLKRRTEMPGMRKDGSLIDLEISLIATPYRDQIQFTAFIQDITDRKQLLKSLEETLQVAEMASSAKSEFIANTSHEIRTPMNAIIGFTELALKMDLTPKLRDYQEKVKNASHSLMGLLDDVLDFSKIEAGHLELDPIPFELNDLFDRLSDLFSMQTSDKNIELIFSVPPMFNQVLVGDSQRLEQVLINLVRNAIKFTETGMILVDAKPSEIESCEVDISFSVQDSGIGIAADRLPLLFDPFVQADGSTTRKYGGTGLGLTICKRLVELMNGTIGATSTPGEGSTFYFSVPFESRPTVHAIDDAVPKHAKGSQVLIVDDNRITREILQNMVSAFPMSATLVASGEAAVAELMSNYASNRQFSLVLMDWRMEGVNGIVAAKQIRKFLKSNGKPGVAEPKIIMMTAFGDDETRQLALESGIDAFLSKPITRAHLVDAIRQVFGERPVGGDSYVRILAEEAETTDKISGARILLADDNHINQQVAFELLQRVGLSVDLVENGLQVLDKLQENSYDAILMDVQMPGMDGMEATRAIRKQPKYSTLPIIAMTAHALAEDKRKCFAAGMNEHITKPIRPERLYGTLTKLLDSSNLLQPVAVDNDYIEIPEISGLNIEDGLERVLGNRRLYLKLLLRFYEEQQDDVTSVKQALDTGDYHLAGRLVHSIKGVSSNIGAKNLQHKAEVLEKTIKEQLITTIHQAFKYFADAHAVLISGLEIIISLDAASASEVAAKVNLQEVVNLDIARLTVLLEELLLLLNENSVETESILENLANELSSENGGVVKKLADNIDQYEFSAAIELVQDMADSLGINLK